MTQSCYNALRKELLSRIHQSYYLRYFWNLQNYTNYKLFTKVIKSQSKNFNLPILFQPYLDLHLVNYHTAALAWVSNTLKVHLHWQKIITKLLATVAVALLELATLGNMTKIGLLLFSLHFPRWPSPVKATVTAAGSFIKKLNKSQHCWMEQCIFYWL